MKTPDFRSNCNQVGKARHVIARRAQELVEACESDQRTDPCETLASEIIPLCSALQHLNRCGARILKSRRVGSWKRPLWLWGVHSEIQRVPIGKVLVLAAWNYPLLLPGVQIAQALAAGNHVQFKPAPGCEVSSELLVACFREVGFTDDQLVLLDSRVQAAETAIDQAVDLIVLTGGAKTGRLVRGRASHHSTQTIMELSGCDAMVVLDDADLQRVGNALRFGLTFNAGATCIGPRRLIASSRIMSRLLDQIREVLADCPLQTVHGSALSATIRAVEEAIQLGGMDGTNRFDMKVLEESRQMHPLVLTQVPENASICQADLFAPVCTLMEVKSESEAIQKINACPYRLAASVFGSSGRAVEIANQLDVGNVIVNDLIAPTADPRLPFGGRGESGFGVTRGDEGLLAMTGIRVVTRRHGNVLPHLSARQDVDEAVLSASLQVMHGKGLGKKLAGLRQAFHAIKNSR